MSQGDWRYCAEQWHCPSSSLRYKALSWRYHNHQNFTILVWITVPVNHQSDHNQQRWSIIFIKEKKRMAEISNNDH